MKNARKEFIESTKLNSGRKNYEPPRMSVEEFDCQLFLCASPQSLITEIEDDY